MRASVVIATYNRAESLRVTLEGLRRQAFRDFEVVIVAGPCTDATPALLTEVAGDVKVVSTEQRNLCLSRNLGIDAAAGEVVAFIDDDSIPEPYWLEALLAAYADADVGGTGGVVYDHTGVRLQYRFSLCDRLGRGIYDRAPQEEHNRPGADPFVYLQGTNMSFRRAALEQVGGFDEQIEYVWDEADLAARLLDAGWRLAPLDGAAVHHKLLPSSVRRSGAVVTDPYAMVKNRVYFALRNGLGSHSTQQVFETLIDYTRGLKTLADNAVRRGELTTAERTSFEERVDAGFEVGIEVGRHATRGTRALLPRDGETFLPFAVRRRSADPRVGVCVLAHEPPARPVSFEADDVHIVAWADGPYRIDFEAGAWVHRIPFGLRRLPALDGHTQRERLARGVALWWATHAAAARTPVQVVAGDAADTLVCAMDPRWRTVVAEPDLLDVAVEHALTQPVRSVPGDAATAEQAVRAGVQELLEQAGDVADPAAATEQLLERSAFPFDFMAALAPLEASSDEDFVNGVYDVLLRRAPDPQWLEAALDPLRRGLKTRGDIIHEVAKSEEASLLGVDASFTSLVARTTPAFVERLVRDAFFQDDRRFAQLLTAALFGWDAQVEVDAVTSWLAAGESRHNVLRDLVGRSDVRARVPSAPLLLARDFMTTEEMRDRLVELSEADDPRFVDGAYRLLLERDPDPEASSWHRELARTSRRWVLVGIAFSGEAQERGIDSNIVNVVAASIPALNAAPQPTVAEGKVLRTVRAVRDAGRRRVASSARS